MTERMFRILVEAYKLRAIGEIGPYRELHGLVNDWLPPSVNAKDFFRSAEDVAIGELLDGQS